MATEEPRFPPQDSRGLEGGVNLVVFGGLYMINDGQDAKGWQQFYVLFEEDWLRCTERDRIQSITGDSEISMAAYGIFLHGALSWLKSKPPVLKGRSPLELIRAGRKKEVQEVLMRMH